MPKVILDRIQVLDKGFVDLKEYKGTDTTAVQAARRSTLFSDKKNRPDADLIDYLVRNRHLSPFEPLVVTFEIYAPIFVLRQIMRHRSFSFSELSLRYCNPDSLDFYEPSTERIVSAGGTDQQDEVAFLQEEYQDAFDAYKSLQEDSMWPSELARTVIPVGMYSNIWLTGNLRNLWHFLKERMAPGAQYEVQVYAEAMYLMLKELYPVAMEAWERHDLYGLHLSEHEAKGMLEILHSLYAEGDPIFENKRFDRIFWDKIKAYKKDMR